MLTTKAQPQNKSPEPKGQNRLVSAADLRVMFGDVSDMTIWRWLKEEDLKFPKPIYVQRRRFWREAELLEWIARQPRELTT